MTGLEIDNFYKLDDKRYILEENKEFLKWYRDMLKNEFHPILDLKQMQKLINSIVLFFEFKYPDSMLCDTMYSVSLGNEFMKCRDISEKLGMEQLKYRLKRDYVQFLDCSYRNYLFLHKFRNDLCELSIVDIEVHSDGSLKKNNLQELNDNKFLSDIKGIETIEDLLLRFQEEEANVDYSELKRVVLFHRNSVALRNKILQLIPFALVYSSNTLPKMGYKRAKSFMRMFHQEYGIDFDYDELDEIMNRDYSKKSSFIRCLKKK